MAMAMAMAMAMGFDMCSCVLVRTALEFNVPPRHLLGLTLFVACVLSVLRRKRTTSALLK